MPRFVCEQCGREFVGKMHRTKSGEPRRMRFCSRDCYGQTVHVPSKPCAQCGEPIPQTGWSYESKFCSRACYLSAQERGANYKDGRSLDPDGYVRVWAPDNPMARADGYVLEHRLVMSTAIDRALAPTEVVHHINGDTQDNRLENLMLFATQAEHRRVHAK